MEMLACYVTADVLGCRNGLAVAFAHGLSAEVNAWPIGGSRNSFSPGEQICGLLREQPPALFLIKEEDSARREVLSPRRGNSCRGIFSSQGGGRYAGSLRFDYLGVDLSIEENKKAEPAAPQNLALARPSVLLFSRWVVEPVASEGEVLTQDGESSVSRIVVPVEAVMGLRNLTFPMLGS